MRQLLIALLFPMIVVAEPTPFEAITYDAVLALDWELHDCNMWLGSKHNGECIWHETDDLGLPVRQASCYMWSLFSSNEEISCVLQNIHPDYPVNPTNPVRVKYPFPGERILWNDALTKQGFQYAQCGHQPRMQQCKAKGDTWFVLCRQFQAAGKLKCRLIEVKR